MRITYTETTRQLVIEDQPNAPREAFGGQESAPARSPNARPALPRIGAQARPSHLQLVRRVA